MKRLPIILGLVLGMVLFAADAAAQARMYGKVLDPEGNPVANAKITFRSTEGGELPPVYADKNGEWKAVLPLGGTWEIDIEAEGFLKTLGTLEVSELSRNPKVKSVMDPVPKPKEPEIIPEIPPSIDPAIIEASDRGQAAMFVLSGRATPEDLAKLGLTAEEAADLSPEKRKELAEGAVVDLEKVHGEFADNSQLTLLLAQAYGQAGMDDKAIEHLREVVQVTPENFGATFLLANYLAKNGDFAGAKGYVDALPPVAFPDAGGLLNLGIYALNKSDFEMAISFFGRAVELFPQDPDSFYHRGLTYLGMKKSKQARADFEKTVELGPQTGSGVDAQALLDEMKKAGQ